MWISFELDPEPMEFGLSTYSSRKGEELKVCGNKHVVTTPWCRKGETAVCGCPTLPFVRNVTRARLSIIAYKDESAFYGLTIRVQNKTAQPEGLVLADQGNCESEHAGEKDENSHLAPLGV